MLVAALCSPAGASKRLLEEVLLGRVLLLLSTPLLLEHEAVLMRPEMLVMANLTPQDVDDILDELSDLCLPVGFDYRLRPVARDPGDDLVVETAVNGRADAIVTFNVADFGLAVRQYGVAVERPMDVLRRLG